MKIFTSRGSEANKVFDAELPNRPQNPDSLSNNSPLNKIREFVNQKNGLIKKGILLAGTVAAVAMSNSAMANDYNQIMGEAQELNPMEAYEMQVEEQKISVFAEEVSINGKEAIIFSVDNYTTDADQSSQADSDLQTDIHYNMDGLENTVADTAFTSLKEDSNYGERSHYSFSNTSDVSYSLEGDEEYVYSVKSSLINNVHAQALEMFDYSSYDYLGDNFSYDQADKLKMDFVKAHETVHSYSYIDEGAYLQDVLDIVDQSRESASAEGYDQELGEAFHGIKDLQDQYFTYLSEITADVGAFVSLYNESDKGYHLSGETFDSLKNSVTEIRELGKDRGFDLKHYTSDVVSQLTEDSIGLDWHQDNSPDNVFDKTMEVISDAAEKGHIMTPTEFSAEYVSAIIAAEALEGENSADFLLENVNMDSQELVDKFLSNHDVLSDVNADAMKSLIKKAVDSRIATGVEHDFMDNDLIKSIEQTKDKMLSGNMVADASQASQATIDTGNNTQASESGSGFKINTGAIKADVASQKADAEKQLEKLKVAEQEKDKEAEMQRPLSMGM